MGRDLGDRQVGQTSKRPDHSGNGRGGEESTAASETLSNKHNGADSPKVPMRRCEFSAASVLSVSAEASVGTVLVEDQVRAVDGPDLQRQHLGPQTADPITVIAHRDPPGPRRPFRKRPAQPVIRVQPRPLSQPRSSRVPQNGPTSVPSHHNPPSAPIACAVPHISRPAFCHGYGNAPSAACRAPF